ncbi:MAG: hypothetical protein ACKPEY_00725 [Planctomycetota bacterium]
MTLSAFVARVTVVRILSLGVAVALSLGTDLTAGVGGARVHAQVVVAPGGATPAWQQYQQFNIPGFYALAQELVRKEIDIVPEQEDELKKVAKESQDKMQEMYAPLRNATLSNEERMQMYQEMQKQMKEIQTQAEQRVRKILLPHQIKTLETVQLRIQIGNLLQYGPALERVGLTEQQKQRIQKNRAELAQKLHDLQREAFQEIMEVLTPEQVDLLKQPFNYGQPGGAIGGQPAAGQGKNPSKE